ncbi:hypothetical protein BU198_04725 [Streptomyces sp. CBMA156]|nr:hypothetical protein [Streptomyces sp. CBMA156]
MLAAAALAVAAGGLLAGCSRGDGGTTQAPWSRSTPDPTASTAEAIDAGSPVGHLPDVKDKAIQSPRFTDGLADYRTNATPSPTPGTWRGVHPADKRPGVEVAQVKRKPAWPAAGDPAQPLPPPTGSPAAALPCQGGPTEHVSDSTYIRMSTTRTQMAH